MGVASKFIKVEVKACSLTCLFMGIVF